mmetsp:Transcript_12276/g.18403  ORF Transcript_12276/g.18403 Transcript_12276/m.18403 type:complete len:91 (-) Transcript_12276:1399-1671(-)
MARSQVPKHKDCSHQNKIKTKVQTSHSPPELRCREIVSGRVETSLHYDNHVFHFNDAKNQQLEKSYHCKSCRNGLKEHTEQNVLNTKNCV